MSCHCLNAVVYVRKRVLWIRNDPEMMTKHPWQLGESRYIRETWTICVVGLQSSRCRVLGSMSCHCIISSLKGLVRSLYTVQKLQIGLESVLFTMRQMKNQIINGIIGTLTSNHESDDLDPSFDKFQSRKVCQGRQ